jgi:hypothetical protein
MELKTACSYATVSARVYSELAAELSGLPHTGESGSLLKRRQHSGVPTSWHASEVMNLWHWLWKLLAKVRKSSCGEFRKLSRKQMQESLVFNFLSALDWHGSIPNTQSHSGN